MLFILLLFTLLKIICVSSGNVGSTLFVDRHIQDSAECWSEDDVAKLRARKVFEDIIPPQVVPEQVNDKYIKHLIAYFNKALHMVNKIDDHHEAEILKKSLVDTIGGHLRAEILPTTRFAYYAGYVPYGNVRQLHDYLNTLKTYLNTQGIGWKEPVKNPLWSNITVVKIVIGSGKFYAPCSSLVTKRDSNSCIHIPVPKMDDVSEPSAMALPFKKGGLISLFSPESENVLMKYYATASRCILQGSPSACRHSDFISFNNEMWHWMKRDVAPRLMDEKLYAAFGGVFRIVAALQSYSKGPTRRNLFQDKGYTMKWHPLHSLTQPLFYVNADWSPNIYVVVVIVAALLICLLQICYFSIFGTRCRYVDVDIQDSQDGNENVANEAVTVSQQYSDVHFKRRKQMRRRRRKLDSASSSTGARTQVVYDMMENTEKIMPVIMSANEGTVMETSSNESDGGDRTVIALEQPAQTRPMSPPKIETSISQLKIEKVPRARVPMYSTSTATRTEVTYGVEDQSDTNWTGTVTSTSGRSVSSLSSKSQSRRTRRSRDLTWARRVISQHSLQNQMKSTTSRTDLDLNSFTLPPSGGKTS